MQSLVTSLEFGCIWMDGKRSKRGVEIYTPVHVARMCYVSCMKVVRWPQHHVLDGLFVHSAGDAECVVYLFTNGLG